MKQDTAPIPLAGSQLTGARHVCAFFNSDEEQYRILLPFIREGFEAGHKAIHVVSPARRAAHLQRMIELGIDPTTAQQAGQLELRTNVETYLHDGSFDQDRMLESFEYFASDVAKGSFPINRIVCQMDWAADHPSRLDDLIEFEARVNGLWSCTDDAVICTYSLTRFGGETVVDIMRTHPMIIIGGLLLTNPFFVPPAEFLAEMRTRRAERTSSPISEPVP